MRSIRPLVGSLLMHGGMLNGFLRRISRGRSARCCLQSLSTTLNRRHSLGPAPFARVKARMNPARSVFCLLGRTSVVRSEQRARPVGGRQQKPETFSRRFRRDENGAISLLALYQVLRDHQGGMLRPAQLHEASMACLRAGFLWRVVADLLKSKVVPIRSEPLDAPRLASPRVQYIICRDALLRKRITLAWYDFGGAGFLREADLENFLQDEITNSPILESLEASFQTFYVCTAARKFFFFLDPQRRHKIRIKELVKSPILDDLLVRPLHRLHLCLRIAGRITDQPMIRTPQAMWL